MHHFPRKQHFQWAPHRKSLHGLGYKPASKSAIAFETLITTTNFSHPTVAAASRRSGGVDFLLNYSWRIFFFVTNTHTLAVLHCTVSFSITYLRCIRRLLHQVKGIKTDIGMDLDLTTAVVTFRSIVYRPLERIETAVFGTALLNDCN